MIAHTLLGRAEMLYWTQLYMMFRRARSEAEQYINVTTTNNKVQAQVRRNKVVMSHEKKRRQYQELLGIGKRRDAIRGVFAVLPGGKLDTPTDMSVDTANTPARDTTEPIADEPQNGNPQSAQPSMSIDLDAEESPSVRMALARRIQEVETGSDRAKRDNRG